VFAKKKNIMFKRAMCLLILLSFLLVKHTPLFVPDQKAVAATEHQDDFPETEKENKEPLVSYDEFLHESPVRVLHYVQSRMMEHVFILKISTPYLSLPYTPPDMINS